jgi:hypothetical protein
VVPEPANLEARIRLLVNALREQRVLIVIDNLESLYLEGDVRGRLRPEAETILEVFEGQIDRFLAQDFLVFGSIADLIGEQIERLSILELMILRWLTIARAPIPLEALRLMMVTPPPLAQVLEAIDALRRRSLIEQGHETGTFILPPLLMEYMTNDLVSEATREIQDGRLALLMMYEFTQVQASEDVRQAQERLLVAPILTQLKSLWRDPLDIQTRLLTLLDPLRGGSEAAQGYGVSNLVTMLRLLRGDLSGLDLSDLHL